MPAPADGRGVGIASNPIPALPSMVGVQVYAQAFNLMPCGVAGVGASSGLHVTVQ